MLKNIKNYILLCRFDVTIVTFLFYLMGILLIRPFNLTDTYMAFLISAAFNFIYSFNSWADWKIDRINKPERPIPSGKIRPIEAFIYSVILFVLCFVLSLILESRLFMRVMYLFLLIAGIFYSEKHIYLKKYIFPAWIITAIGVAYPIIMGYSAATGKPQIHTMIILVLIKLFSIVPMKDIEDKEGDIKAGCQNWAGIFGISSIVYFALAGLLTGLMTSLFLNLNTFTHIIFILLFTSSSIITYHYHFNLKKSELIYNLVLKNTMGYIFIYMGYLIYIRFFI